MDSGQKTALMLAAERGHVSVAKELILNGADPNGTSKLLGFTPLMAAAAWGQADVITLLISAGADVDARTVTANAVSAIDIAQKRGHGEVVRKLLVAGATLPAMVDPTRSVLELAASNATQQRGEDRGQASCVIL
jgi:ankyrin repeat protein